MMRNKLGTDWVKKPSRMRTLASAKTRWRKASGPKPRGGDMGVDGVPERRKRGA